MHNLSLFIIILGFSIVAEECPHESDQYEHHIATKTPYRVVANKNTSKLEFKDCAPQKIWMLVRHGTRNPSAGLIENMKERLVEIRDLILEYNPEASERLLHSDIYALQKWKTKLEGKAQKKLTHEGEDEMLELAERMQARFPTLFPFTYSNTSYFFKYTATQRTKASANYFAAGLFGRQAVKDVWFPQSLKKDPILRFYKLCNKWTREVKNNPDALEERKDFEASPEMLQAINSINKKLNLPDEDNLNFEDIHLIYMTCSFETAWTKKKKSPWCSVLTPHAFTAMEYAEDLKYYYRDGYGYELTYRQACPAFNDLIKYFERDYQYPKSTVYFTHSGTLLKMLAHLGLYKDAKPLTHKDFDSNKNRSWRVSKIDPFGTNLAFVLYRCGTKKKMLVLHQEQIVQLPNCDELCDLKDVKKFYSKSIDCEFNDICNNKT